MIKEVSFKNYQCFRGEHIVKLEPKAYAITARYEVDPGRSNMGGKSAFLEGINFTMTGRFSKFRNFDANGWITKGENHGWHQIVFEDGTIMRRERYRGKRTDVTMTSVNGVVSTQETAEKDLMKHLAFSVEDADTVAYFEQDMMNRIVRTESEKRFDTIRGWLGLQRAQLAEDRMSDVVKMHTQKVTKLKQRREALLAMFPEENDDALSLPDMEKKYDALSGEIGLLEENRETLTSLSADVRLLAQYDALVTEGKAAAEEVEAIPEDLEERLTSTEEYIAQQQSAYDEARRNAASKKKTSLGQFDGKCPVADIECPATKRINAGLSSSKVAYDAARVKEERTEKTLQQARTGAVGIRSEARDAIYKRANLEKLRERATAMHEEARTARKRVKIATKKIGDIEEIEEKIDSLRGEKAELGQLIAEHKAHLKAFDSLTAQVKACEEELEEESKFAATATISRTVLRAAQRRVAERALENIGDNANKGLRNAAIDLNIEVQWEREGKGYAKSCEMCGASFPASAKVKRCETCDAERGQNIVQSLEFILSDRSGGADDFAGIALQLAAGSYLLRLRQSSWASVMIDEPFAKMDQTIRRAAAKQLLRLLGEGAYRQVMVISHSQDTVNLYPARINIHVARDGTRTIETT